MGYSEQLWIVIKANHHSFSEVSDEEKSDLSLMITKVTSVMKKRFSRELVVSFTNTSRKAELIDRLVINILPSLSEKQTKDLLRKVDSHLYVCSGKAIDPRPALFSDEESKQEEEIWSKALEEEMQLSQSQENTELIPWQVTTINKNRGNASLVDQILRIALEKSVFFPQIRGLDLATIPPDQEVENHEGCAFCRSDILSRQKVSETAHAILLYQQRPQVVDGHFLILPKRHIRYIEKLNEAEWQDIFKIQKVLQGFFKEQFKTEKAYFYVQNGASVGQTVPHMHMHAIVDNASRGGSCFSQWLK